MSLPKNNLGLSLGGKLVQWGSRRLPDFDFEINALPYADVNVLNEGKYLGVILTDDDRFCKSISIKDAFAYTPALLDQKNWKYKYVYSRQFWKDQANLEESLMLYIGSQVS
jgi:hypothetical protein